MASEITTVEQYLSSLPKDRSAALAAVRKVILENLDADFEEGIQYRMIGYYVPHRVFPAGYHCDPKQPLPFAALGSQKNHMSLHLMCLYYGAQPGSLAEQHFQWFNKAWMATGKKLDMGKACIRFKRIEDLPLEVIGECVRRISAANWIKLTLAALESTRKKVPAKKKPVKKAVRVSK